MTSLYTKPEFEEILIESETIMDSEDPNYEAAAEADVLEAAESVWD